MGTLRNVMVVMGMVLIAAIDVRANEADGTVGQWLDRAPRYGGLVDESQIKSYDDDIARWIEEGRLISNVSAKLVDYAKATDLNAYQRVLVIMALGYLPRCEDGMEYLAQSIDNGDSCTRVEAAVSLGRINNDRSLSVLCDTIRKCTDDVLGLTILTILLRAKTESARQCIEWVASHGTTDGQKKDAARMLTIWQMSKESVR